MFHIPWVFILFCLSSIAAPRSSFCISLSFPLGARDHYGAVQSYSLLAIMWLLIICSSNSSRKKPQNLIWLSIIRCKHYLLSFFLIYQLQLKMVDQYYKLSMYDHLLYYQANMRLDSSHKWHSGNYIHLIC